MKRISTLAFTLVMVGLMCASQAWSQAGPPGLASPPPPPLDVIDPLNPIPGGANGTTVACVQAGEPDSGAFLGTFVNTVGQKWVGVAFRRQAVTHFEELRRTETEVELIDPAHSQNIIFDFDAKRLRVSKGNAPTDWLDQSHMLRAADRDGSADCRQLASAALSPNAGKGLPPGATTVQMITIKIGSVVNIKPGTVLSATSGPPCPGQEATHFLCPNKFNCAVNGGVCCPGAGSCGTTQFCDRFVNASCIGPPDPRLCLGASGLPTKVGLHCAPGSACSGGPPGGFICTP